MPEEPKKNRQSARKCPVRTNVPTAPGAVPRTSSAKRLARLFGAKRYIYNWALGLKQEAYEKDKTNLGFVELCKALTELKQQPDTRWLQTLPLVPLQQVLRDLNTAFTRFLKKQAKYPRFKRRRYAGSVRFQLDQRRAQVDRKTG